MASISPVDASFDETLLLRLAREIAMEFRTIEEILSTFKLSQSQFERITTSKRFETILTQELQQWHGARNTTERVRMKSAAMIEESLPDLYRYLHDKDLPLSARVELLKTIAKLGGQGEPTRQEGPGNGFRMVINIGKSAVRLTAEVAQPAYQPDDELTIDHEDFA